MKYLKNKRSWSLWKTKEYLSDDEAELPEKFPCFAYLGVGSFAYEEYNAFYLYREDVDKMLLKIQKDALEGE